MKRAKLYRKEDWGRTTGEHKKGIEPYRSAGRRDYARLIHSPAFRRLQGKTQLFPSYESDFFRNRLTHSLEVAQIAKSIAIRLNSTHSAFKNRSTNIDPDLVEFAGLAHDIGHPPFGHNGEAVLDKLMLDHGGFEGNAQTLRILTRLEKKETQEFPGKSANAEPCDAHGQDLRIGLNLSFRSLAAIVKYDEIIPATKQNRETASSDKHPVKGVYHLEAALLNDIKKRLGVPNGEKLATIEASIMDVADDIAYSTYDIEDSLKAGFLSPLSMISMNDDFKQGIVGGVSRKIEEKYKDKDAEERFFDIDQLNEILAEVFSEILRPSAEVQERLYSGVSIEEATYLLASAGHQYSREVCENGYLRTAFTSQLVGSHIRDIEIVEHSSHLFLSQARLALPTFKKVETLKRYSYELLIASSRLKMAEKRGGEIITKIFDTLNENYELLPEDWRRLYSAVDDKGWKMRVVCDYIAGMTDSYCVEIYSRITGENPMTIWKPH